MARVHLREGSRFRFDGRVFEIKKSHYGGLVEVEDIAHGITYTFERDRIVTALFDGRLRFEIAGSPGVAPPEDGLRTDYRYSDFSLVPAKQRDRAWRRYIIVREVAKIPPHERTRQAVSAAIDDAMAILKEGGESWNLSDHQ
jgi:hypothetical protein